MEPPPSQTGHVFHPDFRLLTNLCNMDTTLGVQSSQILALEGVIDNITARANQSRTRSAGAARSQNQFPQPRLPTDLSAARPPGLTGLRKDREFHWSLEFPVIVADLWLILPTPTRALELYGLCLLIARRETTLKPPRCSKYSAMLRSNSLARATSRSTWTHFISHVQINAAQYSSNASEAFDNLYVLFVPNSPTSVYYHKHILPGARTLVQAFSLMYSRFSSSQCQDRMEQVALLTVQEQAWCYSADCLIDMCKTAGLLQVQLGPAYQNDQHLRDAEAVIDEPLSAYLGLSQTQNSVSVQEACTRAIKVQDDQMRLKAI